MWEMKGTRVHGLVAPGVAGGVDPVKLQLGLVSNREEQPPLQKEPQQLNLLAESRAALTPQQTPER